MIRAYLLDDEPLALERLERMLRSTGKTEICGSGKDPVDAVDEIRRLRPDVLFLDIHMPGLSGFEVLAELPEQPLVIFTTAYDQHALEAFQVNSVDYLLKPIESSHLDRALAKAERMVSRPAPARDISALLRMLVNKTEAQAERLTRIASRVGDKVELIEIHRITHFFAKDKLTFAATAQRSHVIDQTITQLEQKLDPAHFIRIHRATILNLDHLLELHAGLGGGMIARLKDGKRTELSVSRDRGRLLRDRLGL